MAFAVAVPSILIAVILVVVRGSCLFAFGGGVGREKVVEVGVKEPRRAVEAADSTSDEAEAVLLRVEGKGTAKLEFALEVPSTRDQLVCALVDEAIDEAIDEERDNDSKG